jgi:hypothetical protein
VAGFFGHKRRPRCRGCWPHSRQAFHKLGTALRGKKRTAEAALPRPQMMTSGFEVRGRFFAAFRLNVVANLLAFVEALEPSLAAQTNSSKANPEEIRAVFAVHAAMAPCRKIRIEAANEVSPILVPPLVENYARNDATYVALVEGKVTWGEFTRAIGAAHIEGKQKFAAAIAQVGQGLNQSHAAEMARRQQAAAALSNWAYQQQVLLQNQQMINAMNQPRMTNCQYVGAYLQCTSF